MTPTQACPCGSGEDLCACCGRYLDAGELPATAVALMRSRYTAYVLGREDYLLQTWHAATRPERLGLESGEPLRWLGLQVRRTEGGSVGETTGVVEFVARCKTGGRAQRIHEVSRFLHEGGRWFYVDGEQQGRR